MRWQAHLEAGLLDAPLDGEPVFEGMVLDDGDSARGDVVVAVRRAGRG